MDKKTAIKQIAKMAKSDPQKYDLSKLNDAIEMINKAKDVDALLILGKPQDAILRPNLYDFAQDEVDKMKDAIESAGYAVKEVQRMTQDENGRDDYAFVLKDESKKVVWVSKMRPMWNDGDYNLLAVGLNFPALSFQTMDELIEKTVYMLKRDD
jgi:hypothetical protein